MPLFTQVRGETVWKIAEGVSSTLLWRQEAADRDFFDPSWPLRSPDSGSIPNFQTVSEGEFCEVRMQHPVLFAPIGPGFCHSTPARRVLVNTTYCGVAYRFEGVNKPRYYQVSELRRTPLLRRWVNKSNNGPEPH